MSTGDRDQDDVQIIATVWGCENLKQLRFSSLMRNGENGDKENYPAELSSFGRTPVALRRHCMVSSDHP